MGNLVFISFFQYFFSKIGFLNGNSEDVLVIDAYPSFKNREVVKLATRCNLNQLAEAYNLFTEGKSTTGSHDIQHRQISLQRLHEPCSEFCSDQRVNSIGAD